MADGVRVQVAGGLRDRHEMGSHLTHLRVYPQVHLRVCGQVEHADQVAVRGQSEMATSGQKLMAADT